MPEVLDRHRWLVPVAVYGAILVATLWPFESSDDGPQWIPVAFHVVTYAVLAASIRWTWPDVHPLGVILVCVGLGLANEYAQLAFTDDRAFQLSDLAADAVGATVATGIWTLRSS